MAFVLNPQSRAAIIGAYKNKCQYCGCDGADHIDHIIPRSKGGKDVLGNLILACQKCNLRKSNGVMPETYIALISAIADKHEKRILRKIQSPVDKEVGPSPWKRLYAHDGSEQILVRVDAVPTMEQADRLAEAVSRLVSLKERGPSGGSISPL